MVLKVCGYYWINVSPIKEIIIRCLCTFKLTLKRSLWRIVRLPRLRIFFISSAFNALATEGNTPSPADPGFLSSQPQDEPDTGAGKTPPRWAAMARTSRLWSILL